MAAAIQPLPMPAIHYKVLAAGRNHPHDAFTYAARTMRRNDAVCVGFFTKHLPTMIEEDIGLLAESLAATPAAEPRREPAT
jgi:hypothetical protein